MITYHDVSHYDYDSGYRGHDIADQPLLVAKATEGTNFTDPAYTYWRDQAARHRVPFAAYHYQRTSDPTAQAQQIARVVGTTIPVMLDVEEKGGDVANTLAIAQAYHALGGKVTLVYLPQWWWERIGKPSLTPLVDAGMALISSNYPDDGYSDDGPGWTAYGGVTPSIWQFTSQPHDTNAYRGTAAQLVALVGAVNPGETGPPTTEEIVRELPMIRSGSTGQYVRNAQGLLNAHGANLALDRIFGPLTDGAVRRFQVTHSVPNSVANGNGDGIIGPYTWAALLDVS